MFREWKKTRVSFEEFGTAMSASSLRHHMEIYHWIVMTQTQGVEFGGGGSKIYVVSFNWVLKLVGCPMDRCLER